MCFTYKYITSSTVREEGCRKYCREHNWVYYRPDLLDVKQFLGFAERNKEFSEDEY